MLKYLGRYTHRVGIANSRLLSMVDGVVTFRTKDGKTASLPAGVFLARFLQHVLPRGFVKIRHYGLYAPGHACEKLEKARALLAPKMADAQPSSMPLSFAEQLRELTGRDIGACPECGGPLVRRPLARGPP